MASGKPGPVHLRIDRGLVRLQVTKASRRRAGDKRAHTSEVPLSAKLVEELSAHRTAALRLELAGRPDIALAATVHALALSALYHAHGVGSCLTLKGSHVPLETHARDSEDGLVHHDLADLQATWSARLPEAAAELWDWCLAQKQAVLLDLLAFIAALSVNAVATRQDQPNNPRLQHAGQLSATLHLDMTKWWRASPQPKPTRGKDPCLKLTRRLTAPMIGMLADLHRPCAQRRPIH